MSSNFDLEHKISYDELTPSLQALFKNLQAQITDNRNEITKNREYIDSVYNQLQTSITPIGSIMVSHRVIPGYVKLDGSIYERSKYPDLFKFAQDNNLLVDEATWESGRSPTNTMWYSTHKGLFSTGDGSTTFRVPDFRDCFVRGLDDGRGYDPNRKLGTEQRPTLVSGHDDNEPDNNISFLRGVTKSGLQFPGCMNTCSGDYYDLNDYEVAQQVTWTGNAGRSTYASNTAKFWYNAVRPRNVALFFIMKAEFGNDLSAGDGDGGGGDIEGGGEVPVDPPYEPDPGEDFGKELEELQKQVDKLVPIGTVRYAYTKPSDDWVKANGALLSRTDYKELYEYANTNGLIVSEQQWNSGYTNNYSYIGLYSDGDGSTTFRIPDYRSCFIRGLDDGRNIDPDRILGTEQLPTLIPGYEDNSWGDTLDSSQDFTFISLRGLSYNKDTTVGKCWSGDNGTSTNIKYYGEDVQFSNLKNNSNYNYGVQWYNFKNNILTDGYMNLKSDGPINLNNSPDTMFTYSRSRNIALTVWIKTK